MNFRLKIFLEALRFSLDNLNNDTLTLTVLGSRLSFTHCKDTLVFRALYEPFKNQTIISQYAVYDVKKEEVEILHELLTDRYENNHKITEITVADMHLNLLTNDDELLSLPLYNFTGNLQHLKIIYFPNFLKPTTVKLPGEIEEGFFYIYSNDCKLSKSNILPPKNKIDLNNIYIPKKIIDDYKKHLPQFDYIDIISSNKKANIILLNLNGVFGLTSKLLFDLKRE